MINFLMIMEKAVCTLGLITIQDQKIKSNNYHFFVSDAWLTFWFYFCCNILTGSKDTVPWKSDVSFLFEYISVLVLRLIFWPHFTYFRTCQYADSQKRIGTVYLFEFVSDIDTKRVGVFNWFPNYPTQEWCAGALGSCKCSKMLNTSYRYVPKSHRQTEQTKIRLLMKKHTDQGLPCFLFCQAFVNSIP